MPLPKLTSFLFRGSIFAAIVAFGPALWGADDLGYGQLQTYLNGNAPTGAGVTVGQIEAPSDTDYAPNIAAPQFTGITFHPMSGLTNSTTHATTVATNYYGSSSIASGVTHVYLYNANTWVGNDYLHAGTQSEPGVSPAKILNHSWIATSGDDLFDAEILRRMDFAIQYDQTIVVAGIDNGTGSTVPRLMSSFYNGISVGVTSGNHSRGGTTFDLAGRIRPDIVAPASATSFATPLVSASAAVLVQAAGATPSATRADVIKSILMAGATKEEFGANWSRTNTQPLDLVFGAGEVNVFNSYRILEAGPQAPATNALVGRMGWSFSTVLSGNTRTYFFDVPDGYQLLNLSAILAWDRIIDGNLDASLANLSLGLYSSSGFVLGSELDWSDSALDNVEHIWRPGALSAGQYALVVASPDMADFALSWRSDLVAIPEPSTTAIILASGLFLYVAARRNARSCERTLDGC